MHKTFDKWLSQITRGKSIYDFVNFLKGSNKPEEECSAKIYLYSHDYKYSIAFKWTPEHSYLGCQCETRKPRAGEDWNRGMDLADGDFSENTWNLIKNSIIANELVKIAKKERFVPVIGGEQKCKNQLTGKK
jgi:hypothetical protein